MTTSFTSTHIYVSFDTTMALFPKGRNKHSRHHRSGRHHSHYRYHSHRRYYSSNRRDYSYYGPKKPVEADQSSGSKPKSTIPTRTQSPGLAENTATKKVSIPSYKNFQSPATQFSHLARTQHTGNLSIHEETAFGQKVGPQEFV